MRSLHIYFYVGASDCDMIVLSFEQDEVFHLCALSQSTAHLPLKPMDMSIENLMVVFETTNIHCTYQR